MKAPGPAIKADILAPFKMQGVADIADNALLVRFKFTAKPGNPAIQREAVKRGGRPCHHPRRRRNQGDAGTGGGKLTLAMLRGLKALGEAA